MKRVFFLIILLSSSVLFCFGEEDDMIKIQMLIFLTDDCAICDDFISFILPDMETKHNLEYTLYYEFEDNAKTLLKEIEKEFGKIEVFPIILMGSVLIKGDEIYSKLETTIEEYASLGGCCVPLLFEVEERQESSDKFPVHIAYIYGKNSTEFKRTNSNFNELEEKYPLLIIKKFNIETDEGKLMNNALCKFYHLAEKDYKKTPKVFIGDDTLLETQVNFNSIKMLIIKYRENEETAPWEKISKEMNPVK